MKLDVSRYLCLQPWRLLAGNGQLDAHATGLLLFALPSVLMSDRPSMLVLSDIFDPWPGSTVDYLGRLVYAVESPADPRFRYTTSPIARKPLLATSHSLISEFLVRMLEVINVDSRICFFTKHPERMNALLSKFLAPVRLRKFKPSFGVVVSDQETADALIPTMAKRLQSRPKMLSVLVEPPVSEIDLTAYLPMIDHVFVRPHVSPSSVKKFHRFELSIQRQCASENIPCFAV
jgi:hypothetical protein